MNKIDINEAAKGLTGIDKVIAVHEINTPAGIFDLDGLTTTLITAIRNNGEDVHYRVESKGNKPRISSNSAKALLDSHYCEGSCYVDPDYFYHNVKAIGVDLDYGANPDPASLRHFYSRKQSSQSLGPEEPYPVGY